MSIRASLLSFYLKRTLKKQFLTQDLEAMREAGNRSLGKPPAEVETETVNAGGVAAEWVTYAGVAEDSVLMYLHGGGYVFGGPDSHRDLAWRLGREIGCRVLVVDYRLAPASPFPVAVEDATAAWRWLLDEGYRPEKLILGGDSAGGGLAVSLMVNARNLGLPQPMAASLLSPWADLALTGDSLEFNAERDAMLAPETLAWFASNYLGERDPKAPLASPIYADLTGLPPVQVLVGDTEVLLSDSQRLVEKLREDGGEATLSVYPGMPHVFPLFAALVPEARQGLSEIATFLRQAAGTKAVD